MRDSNLYTVQVLLITVPAVLILGALACILFFFSQIRFYNTFKDSVDLREQEWNRFMWDTQLLLVDESLDIQAQLWKTRSGEYRTQVEMFIQSSETVKAEYSIEDLRPWIERLDSFHKQIFVKFSRVEESLAQFIGLVAKYPEYRNRRVSELIDVDETARENGEIAFAAYRIFDSVNNGLMLSSPAFHPVFDQINTIIDVKLAEYYRFQTVAIALLLVFAIMLNIQVFYSHGRQTRAELTARRASEEAALRINQELEYRVEERTAELQDALDEYTRINTQLTTTNNRLEEAMHTINAAQEMMVEQEKQAALGRLVAGLAHDVNTPLGVSLTAATLIKSKLTRTEKIFGTDEKSVFKGLSDSADLLVRNIRKTADIVRYFKQLSLDQQGVSNRRVFDLVEYLTSLAKTLTAPVAGRGCFLDLKLPRSLMLDSFPGAFSYAVSNLINNAAQHAYGGIGSGGEIDVRLELVDEKNLFIYCSDHGHGIPPELIKTIFDPFVTTQRSFGSSGLGLSIAYNYVTQVLKGGLTCTSQVGYGTVFTIHVPVEKQDSYFSTP